MTYQDLSIHLANKDDYYEVGAAEAGSLSVSLAFQHSEGDIDLQIFDAAETLLGTSESVGNAEQVSVNATQGEAFYVRAYGYNGAVNPNYSMTVDQSVPPSGGDAYEPNDTFATATAVT